MNIAKLFILLIAFLYILDKDKIQNYFPLQYFIFMKNYFKRKERKVFSQRTLGNVLTLRTLRFCFAS